MKERVMYRIVRPIISGLFKMLYRPTIIGKENIPSTRRIILAGNHTNNFDCLLLISSTRRPIHFLAKNSLMKGMKKIIFNGMGIIPVDRSKKDSLALQTATKMLEEEKVIGIFPEGTINRTKDITMPFKFGAVKMANATGALIVPFVITGHYKPFRKSIRIEFLKPVLIGDDLEEENRRLREKISLVLEKTKEDL